MGVLACGCWYLAVRLSDAIGSKTRFRLSFSTGISSRKRNDTDRYSNVTINDTTKRLAIKRRKPDQNFEISTYGMYSSSNDLCTRHTAHSSSNVELLENAHTNMYVRTLD